MFTDVLAEEHRRPRGDITHRITRWLSGARDRRAGAEPARKRSRTDPAPTTPALSSSGTPAGTPASVSHTNAAEAEAEAELSFSEL